VIARPHVSSARPLPTGTRLRGEFEIVGVLHAGEFGISYLAEDRTQSRRVVIKEYLPARLAERGSGESPDVVLKEIPGAGAFLEGLKSFVHEARLLVAFDTPGLVPVLRLWKQHGTAYMVLRRIEGMTWRDTVAESGAPDEGRLREWLRPLLDALELLHASRCIHGNITPDNIMIASRGATLLGFGGGRRAVCRTLGEPSETLEPGHAAIEQYGVDAATSEGPWTDLYALSSVVYTTLAGHGPMSALARRTADPLVPLRRIAGGRYSDALLDAIDAALALRPGERPKNVATFRALLEGNVKSGAVGTAASRSGDRAPAATPARWHSARAYGFAAALVCAIAVGVLAFAAFGPTRVPPLPIASPSSDTSPLEMPPTSAGVMSAGKFPAAAMPDPSSIDAVIAPPPSNLHPALPVPALPTDHKHARTTPAATPATSPAANARCSDLLRRASLESLTRAQAAILKRECR
jgi:serine/threonine protein kinase